MAQPAVILLGGLVATWNHRFLRAAHDRGLEVLLVDTANARLGAARSAGVEAGGGHPWSRVAEIGEHDSDAARRILDTCLEWAGRYDIRGACSLREEFVTAAALVADVLGLPSPGRRAARVCRNKYLQRRYLARWSPHSELISPERRESVAGWTRFPAVLKPVGRLASSGVRLVHDADELRASLHAYADDEVLLLEERVEGQEYSVESLSRRGERRYAEITEKRTTEDDGEPYFVELGHTTPAPLPGETRNRLLATHDEILARLGFDTGMAHGEYRITPDGGISLTEIAVRPPGDAIMNLHGLATGGSLEDLVVGLAVGDDPDVPAAPTRWARQVFLPHQPGTLDGVEITAPLGAELRWFDPTAAGDLVPETSRADDPPTVRCLMALKPAGARLSALHESADRAATFVIDAASRPELDRLEQAVRTAVRLKVVP
ncbi:ATP-grasp domain-containing protein [Nonomuraea sp. NN258]|uniref:ATP-grasp domain-containing protein n=1 Tax=Nonomuraea antri TaxID=2730852 RepID=UPI001569901D|nr:ATP-grasp domain-containing protein [Nonomuraea antri]NRQ37768.1 ATP-grasp domain-containing protein [Nonomuraea antri]